MNPANEQPVFAMDVGGTSVKSGLVWPGSRVDHVESARVNSHSIREHVLEELCAPLRAALDRGISISRVAVAFPAPFDYAAGTPLLRHKYGALKGHDLAAAIRDTVGEPDLDIRFINDAEAAAVGEAHAGSGRSADTMLMITLGTGLGAAMTHRGRIVPAVGDFVVGDLYTLPASAEHDAVTADEVFSGTGLCTLFDTDADRLPDAVADPANLPLLRNWVRRLTRFLAEHLDQLEADCLVVGGGASPAVAFAGDDLTDGLGIPWRLAQLGTDAALLGAARGTGSG